MPMFEHDGCQLHYDDAGSGAPLVLIHGAVASARQFADLVPHLVDRFRVIVPDLRGMGRSEPGRDVGPSDWADDVVALLDHLDVERAHVAGSSLGARVAMRVALDRPDRVIALALDAPIVSNQPSGDATLDALLGADMPAEFARLVERWQGGPGWRDVVASYSRVRAQTALQQHYDLRDRLGDLPLPLLVTRGDVDDAIHPIAHSAEIHAACPSSWLWIAPRTGFAAMRFRPAEFAALLSELVGSAS